jgi:hypothetical protein
MEYLINRKTENMNIDKIKKELTQPIFEHLNTLDRQQLEKQKTEIEKDIQLISGGAYIHLNCNDLVRIRLIELNYINYLLN